MDRASLTERVVAAARGWIGVLPYQPWGDFGQDFLHIAFRLVLRNEPNLANGTPLLYFRYGPAWRSLPSKFFFPS